MTRRSLLPHSQSIDMQPLNLPTCPFLGPSTHPSRTGTHGLPPDYDTQPFKYLPPRIVLSDAELDLAMRYENGDFSGGYVTSQIARFRRGPSAEQHQQRRDTFRRLKAEVDRLGLVLPDAFVELVMSDDYVTRLRHNTIWLRLPDELVPLPSNPEYTLFLIFSEGQGCGYWHLVLGRDGSHVVAFSEHHFGLHSMYPGGYEPDVSAIEICQCARSFSEWIVLYFADCIEGDRHYEMMLQKYPGR
jgi:hypothetical protein